MTTKDKIAKELENVNQELIMSSYNDGWWNQYMKERKVFLENLLNQIAGDDNNNLLDTQRDEL